MLCDVCNNIDLVKASDRHKREQCSHHKSYADIRRSAARGCEVCGMIVAYVSQIDENTSIDWDEVEKGMENTQVRYLQRRAL